MKISVVGLGKLGAPLMAVMASNPDNFVVGVDVSESTAKMINEGLAPVQEPGLQELMKANASRFTATTNMARVADTDVTFVIVPTPSNTDGTFSADYVLGAIGGIGKAIKGKKRPHLVVITSTVMPGTTGGVVTQMLRSQTGKLPGPGLGLCYSPHLIALGSVIDNMMRPDLVLIGQSSVEAGDWLQETLMGVIINNAPIARLTLQEAELAKISINSYVTMKMSFANTLAEICEGMPKTDALNVTKAIGLDSRIGSKYIQPSTAWGGPCFPRDGEAFLAMAKQVSVPAPLAQATIDVNDRQIGRLANLLERVTPLDQRIGVLGLTYKPGTPVITRSAGMAITKEMIERGYSVVIYDPLVMPQLYAEFKDAVIHATSVAELLKLSQTVVVAQPCPEFVGVGDAEDHVVIDLWGMFTDKPVLRPGVHDWGLT